MNARLQQLEQKYTALDAQITDSPMKQALSILHAMVHEVRREAGTSPGGVGRGLTIPPGAHRLKRRRGREVLLRLRVIKLMIRRHGLEAIARLIAAQRPAQRVQVRRVAIDQQLGDSLSVGERTGREYAT